VHLYGVVHELHGDAPAARLDAAKREGGEGVGTRVNQVLRRRYGILLAAAAATLPSPSTRAATTPANWLTASSGNWTDATKWSTSPAYPNNAAPVDDYDVAIDATGSSYTVTLNAASAVGGLVTVNSLSLDSSDVKLQLPNGTFTATSGVTVEGGSFTIAGGTLKDTSVSGSGGEFRPYTGTLDHVTIARDALLYPFPFSVPPPLQVRNGLTLASGARMQGASLTGIDFSGTQTLGGSGEIVLANSGMRVTGGSTLTIAAGITVHGNGNITNFPNATLVNHGAIRADGARLELGQSGTYVNNGLIEAAGAAAIIPLQGAIDNTNGILRADGGKIIFDLGYTGAPVISTAKLGTLQALNGGKIVLGGSSTTPITR